MSCCRVPITIVVLVLREYCGLGSALLLLLLLVRRVSVLAVSIHIDLNDISLLHQVLLLTAPLR